jgi:putative spermidine/putrescine transport system ATP-binding protein
VTLSTSGAQRDNEVEARIEEIVYLGDHVRVRTSACGSNEFVIKVPNSATWQTELQEQQTIRVSWNTTDCRALSLAS